MSRKAFVSAVIPCYNNEEHISSAINSLINQTRKPDEIIIVDDGSKDKSKEIISEFEKKYDFIKVFFNENNKGIPYTRNRLIKEMEIDSDYMVILDGDDVALPERIENQILFLDNHSEYAIIGSDTEIIDEKDKKIGLRVYPHTKKEIIKKALIFNPFAQSSVTVRKSIIDKIGLYDEKLKRAQDYDLWLRIIRAGYGVINLDKPLTQFRRHKNQGKEKFAKKSLYYSWIVRSRYIFDPFFFSIKGFLIFTAYTFLILLPKSLLGLIYNNFLMKND